MSGALTIAIIGPAGVGRIHAREFSHAGARIVAVLASTSENTKRAATELERQFGGPIRSCADMDAVLDAASDIVVVCTPPELHLPQIKAALSAGKYVFCEKPLFWRPGLDAAETGAICDRLATLAPGRLAVNTNNVYLLTAHFEHFGLPPGIDDFEFRFFTRGRYRGDAIGLDLLPHALSLLLLLAPDGDISELEKTIGPDRFMCTFAFSGMRCRFELREDPQGPQDLEFALNGRRVRRIQEVVDDEFRVYLAAADAGGERIRIADPFRTSVTGFVDAAGDGASFDVAFAVARRNMVLMSQILAAPEGGTDD